MAKFRKSIRSGAGRPKSMKYDASLRGHNHVIPPPKGRIITRNYVEFAVHPKHNGHRACSALYCLLPFSATASRNAAIAKKLVFRCNAGFS
jgi:hypothetical protein